MDTKRRHNYDSGSDYVLEYGDLQFSFNEQDFTERIEQAARRLDFVKGNLHDRELEDLICLVVNGEVFTPCSPLGEHVLNNWQELAGPAGRSLVYWLRRLVFRSAWLDQRVIEHELDVVFDDGIRSFKYVHRSDHSELVEVTPEPSWQDIAYQPA